MKYMILLAGIAIGLLSSSYQMVQADEVMGLYEGTRTVGGETQPVEAYVIGRGNRNYEVVLATPPDADVPNRLRMVLQTQDLQRLPLPVYTSADATQPGVDVWHNRQDTNRPLLVQGTGLGTDWQGVWNGDRLVVTPENPDAGMFEMTRTERESPTRGRRPPTDALELLPIGEDGKPQADVWHNASWRRLPDGSYQVGKRNNWTRQEFGDAEIHLEFMLPYMPTRQGQARANSGVYVQGRYELQVLDSFGLLPAHDQCGGVYSIAAPRVNAVLPPQTWQTYDIIFRAPRLADDGSLERLPMFEQVKLNGIIIHENVELPHPTTAALANDHRARGPLMLQDHRAPVRYRNIWIRPLE